MSTMFSMLLSKLDKVREMEEKKKQAPAEREASSDSTIDAPYSESSPFSSTPPTSLGDDASSSMSFKQGHDASTSMEDSTARSRRKRKTVDTYNLKVLSGTAIHAPRKSDSKIGGKEDSTRRRTVSGETLFSTLSSGNPSTETVEEDARRLVDDGIAALDLDWSVKGQLQPPSLVQSRTSPKKSAGQDDLSRRRSTRSTGLKVESLTKQLSVLGKRSRKSAEEGLAKAKRELKNLADTNEYAKIDTRPVIQEVWRNGKLWAGDEPPTKKAKVEEAAAAKAAEEARILAKQQEIEQQLKKKKKQKTWLSKGLYAGQVEGNNFDWFKHKQDWQIRQGNLPPYKPDGFMPLPMWHGQRLFHAGRHFKLPFDVCSPLPPGQPKPDEWRKTSSNRFVGGAAAAWKKSNLFESFSSKCICTRERGCDEDCQNRIMLYECDDTNCAAGRDRCTNRAFADLQERRKQGGKYRIGVEVIKTEDRGYGVRSNRCFDANQIIVEYTGEIITEEECDRRMHEDYKNNECYYLMSFDQNMIIDATKGSIARFVNHSCKPNCRMVKWIVGGKPRMALFAGDEPIMTGDELTYDYNFDPFSAKNVQECRCGSDNCRGVLGPRGKDPKPVKESIKDMVKAGVQAGKRKLKELLGGEADDSIARSPKKRKMKAPAGVKQSASSSSITIAKDAAKVVRTSVASKLANARQAVSKRSTALSSSDSTKTVNKGQIKLGSRNSSLTLVAPDSSPSSIKGKKSFESRKSTDSKSPPRKATKPISKSPITKRKTANKSTKGSPKSKHTSREGVQTRKSSGSPFRNKGKSTKFFEELLDQVTDSPRGKQVASGSSAKNKGKGKHMSVQDSPSKKSFKSRKSREALESRASSDSTIRVITRDDEYE